jgi:hypothetical protein
MATYGSLKSEIADDLVDSNLTTQIAQAILDAVAFHEGERFWFNVTRSYTHVTVADDDTYTLAASGEVYEFLTIDAIEVLVGTQYRPLERLSPDEMRENKESAHTGQPLCWAYLNDEIQYYPTPNDAYTMRVHGHYRLTPLELDADENEWTNAARNLIRTTAKAYLFTHTLKSQEQAAAANNVMLLELDRLRIKTSQRTATGRIRPWC